MLCEILHQRAGESYVVCLGSILFPWHSGVSLLHPWRDHVCLVVSLGVFCLILLHLPNCGKFVLRPLAFPACFSQYDHCHHCLPCGAPANVQDTIVDLVSLKSVHCFFTYFLKELREPLKHRSSEELGFLFPFVHLSFNFYA